VFSKQPNVNHIVPKLEDATNSSSPLNVTKPKGAAGLDNTGCYPYMKIQKRGPF
jgi:hypothetical protein